MKTQSFLLALWIAPGLLSQAEDVERINILHINADDHRPDGLHALGTRVLQTPNLDQLVDSGTTFTHAYTMGSMVGAVCEPSRAMLLTGRSWLRIPKGPAAAENASDTSTFLPNVLERSGYSTWHIGKSGNGFKPGLAEFEISIIDDARGKTNVKESRAESPKRLADRAIEFLKSRPNGEEKKPFYMYIAPPVPHDPRTAEPRFHKLYDPERIKLSPAFKPLHPFNNGDMRIRDEKLAPWPRTQADTKKQNADYYACITGLDFHVGRIFDELKASGEWDNTVVVFTGDNGLSMGDHGLFGKQNLYEFGGMHVPFVIAGPGIPKGKSKAFVYLMDLFPTFTELAGAKNPDGVEGKSLLPVIKGEQDKVRDLMYTAYKKGQRSVRDQRWKLIRYPSVDVTQLFDLENDPLELVNLAKKKEFAEKLVEMTALLKQEMEVYADEQPLTVKNPKPAKWTAPQPEGKKSK